MISSISELLPNALPWWELMALTVAGYALYKVIHVECINPLAKVPGPRLSTLAELFLNLKRAYTQQNTEVLRMHRQYGSILRAGPNTVWVSSAALIRKVNGSHQYAKGRDYNLFRIGHENLFNTINVDYHRSQKRLMLPAFTPGALEKLEPLIVDMGVSKLVYCLRVYADTGRAVNIMNLLRSMTFDITGEVSFGKTFGLLEENQECHPIIEWINDRMAYNSWRYVLGYMFASFMFPKLTNSVEALDNYARAAIHKRRMTGSNERKDTLQQLIEAVDEETGATMSDEGIKSEAILLILAGTDTTAMTITWAIHFLIENPICAGRLLDEIRAIYPDPNKRISHRDMVSLKYLDAVLHEALRLRPPLAHGMPRVIPPEGTTLDKYFIPGGTTVMVSVIAMHMNEQVFPNPQAFSPERWIHASPEELANMRLNFTPFSVGPRACIGRNLAWMVLRLTLVEILRNFTFTPHTSNDCMQPVYGTVTSPKGKQYLVQPHRAY